MTSLLWPRLDDAEEPLAVLLEHLDLALELAVSLSELGVLALELSDLGLCSLRAGFVGLLVAEQASRDVPFANGP